jgi:glycosyltransferase involved in cell wall biosynthesis
MGRPLLLHITTTDISLDWLLAPQLVAFADAGFDVVGASAPGPHVEALRGLGIDHFPLEHATRAMAPIEDVRAAVELYRLFRRLRPVIVHTHNPKPGWLGRPAARAARVPIVVNTVHGLYALPGDPAPKRMVVYALERIAAACSDAELVQSSEDLATLRSLRIPDERLHHLGNGVDLERFDPDAVPVSRRDRIRASWGIGPDEVVCGVVGRLVWEKGLHEVFEAARLLRTEVPRVRVVIVGPTDDAKWDAIGAGPQREAEERGVVFAGRRDDMADVYRAFDLYALASYREGFPRSAMEAAAMGLPVVATDIRGCREVVDHETTGLLVPVRDAPALRGAIARLALDDARRTRLGEAARRKAAADFDQRRVIDRTLAVYEALLTRAGREVPRPEARHLGSDPPGGRTGPEDEDEE